MSANSEDTTSDPKITLPEWLKPEIFVPILEANYKDFQTIKNFRALPGTKPGDNYATIMLRIELDIELKDSTSKSISYMLKISHNSAIFDEVLGKNNVFAMEREMFMKYVEEFKTLYRDVGLDVEFGAKCYKLDIPNDHVLLEDLKDKGFRPTVRQAGLDLEHVQAVLKKLAQWHAASAVRVAKLGPYPAQLHLGLFGPDGYVLMEKMTDKMVKYVLKSLSTIDGHEAYYDNVKIMEGRIVDNVMKVGVLNPDEFNVLNHGDCWLSNMMFQYDEKTGKLLDINLVDYQMPKYGTVAIDLLYFLISSPQLELKVNKFDYFIKYYYDQLIAHLKLLNYTKQLPTLIDIHTSLLKHGIWGYASACGVMTGCLLDSTEAATFDNIFADTPEGEAFRTLLFSGERYKKHIAVVMPWLQNRGALECPIGNEEKKSLNN